MTCIGVISETSRLLMRLAAEGYTSAEAAKMAGVTHSGAKNCAARHGFRFASHSDRIAQKVKDLAAQGLIGIEIAARLGLERSTVCRIKKRYSIEMETGQMRLAAAAARRREEEAAQAAAERAALMARWSARMAEKRAQAVTPPADPVGIVLHHIATHGRISEGAVLRIPEEILGAAMLRVAQGARA